MRIVFMGSADLAIPSLEILLRDPTIEIVGVVTQPDRPAGRRRQPTACPLKACAEKHGLAVATPDIIGAAEAVAALAALRPDLFVVVAYGQFIPERVLALAPYRGINVHPSLLPQYRGAAPIQWAIAHGDTETGVSIIDVAARMDAGDLLLQESLPIAPEDTSQTLHDKLAQLGAQLLLETIGKLRNGTATRCPQDESLATTVRKLSKEDGILDWSAPAETLRNQIRAFNPWPGSRCRLPDGTELKVWNAAVETAEGLPGTLLDDQLLVATGHAALRLLEVQPAGRKRMSAEAFLNGQPLPRGNRLG